MKPIGKGEEYLGEYGGRFVDEIYTEDDEEAARLADEAAMRAARMLGYAMFAAVAIFFMAAILLVWTLWPR